MRQRIRSVMTVVGRAEHNCSICIVVFLCFCLRRRKYGGKEKCNWLNVFVGRAGQKCLISIVMCGEGGCFCLRRKYELKESIQVSV